MTVSLDSKCNIERYFMAMLEETNLRILNILVI
jgi:hypothetical protein